MGVWASIMSAIGPSIVISSMLNLVTDKKRDRGYPPKQIIISTPIEAFIAIVLFGIFSNLEQTSRSSLYPWVETHTLYVNCLLILPNLSFSTVTKYCTYTNAFFSKCSE
jgi:predicted transglutaminase-like protease